MGKPSKRWRALEPFQIPGEEPGRFRGETADLEIAVAIGERWGFGNLIQRLEQAWAEKDAEFRTANGFPPCPEFVLHHRIAAGEVAARMLADRQRRQRASRRGTST